MTMPGRVDVLCVQNFQCVDVLMCWCVDVLMCWCFMCWRSGCVCVYVCTVCMYVDHHIITSTQSSTHQHINTSTQVINILFRTSFKESLFFGFEHSFDVVDSVFPALFECWKTYQFWFCFGDVLKLSIFSTSTHQHINTISSTHQHISTPHQHINTSTHQHSHQRINTSTHQHINTSTHQHSHQHINTVINTSTHQHISTVINSRQRVNTSKHINTSTHQHINISTHQLINTSTHQLINTSHPFLIF